ncbi:hypothetical protein ACSS6W_007762 [Trichoderma asperelloides]
MQQGQEKTGWAQKRTGCVDMEREREREREDKHRCHRFASLDVRAPRKTRPLQPAVHPGKSQRRAAGDASDWLEQHLHVHTGSAVADLYP